MIHGIARPRIAGFALVISSLTLCSCHQPLEEKLVGRWAASRLNLSLKDDGRAYVNLNGEKMNGRYQLDSSTGSQVLVLDLIRGRQRVKARYYITVLGERFVRLSPVVSETAPSEGRRRPGTHLLERAPDDAR